MALCKLVSSHQRLRETWWSIGRNQFVSQDITYIKTKGHWIVEIAGIAQKLNEQTVYFHSPRMI